MIAILVEVFVPAAVIGLGIVIADGNRKIRAANALITVGRMETTPEPLPEYEAGVPVEQWPAGVETDIVQALRHIQPDPTFVAETRLRLVNEASHGGAR